MKRRDDAVEETEEETEESTAAAPSRRSASRAKDNGDERGAARRRRPRDDDDDAEESDFKKPDLSGGWDRSQKRRDTTGGDFADEWRPEPEERLVLLLEDEPYVSYGQHWVDERLSMTKKKGFICLEDDCPLCDIGDNVRAMYQFNAYVFDGDGKGHHVALVLRQPALRPVEGHPPVQAPGSPHRLLAGHEADRQGWQHRLQRGHHPRRRA